MSGYHGTEVQQQLQARVETEAAFTAETPGACQAGRCMASDDPDRLGWERIDAFLTRDGVFGFRLIPSETVDKVRSELERRGFRLDTWDVFLGARDHALPTSEAILAGSRFDGLKVLPSPTDPDGEAVRRIQALLASAGVVPFSGSFLTGRLGPAVTVAVEENRGAVVAAAHAYLPHNAHSPFHQYAWCGLVAVAESQRGRGLGAFVNAQAVVRAFGDLGATHVYELVSATNIASRRMVEACGLRQEPDLVCGIALPGDGGRFTR